MAVLNFPNSPNNGDQYVENGVTYTYSGTHPNGFWQADNRNAAPAPSNDLTVIGTFTNSSQTGSGSELAEFTSAGVLQRLSSNPYVVNTGDTFTGNLIVDGSNRIGVGTSSPSSSIEVSGATPAITIDSTSSAPALILSENGTSTAAVSYNSSQLEIYSGAFSGNPEVVIESTGEVGIGTTNPSGKVDVQGDAGLVLTKGDAARKYQIQPLANLTITETVGNTALATLTPTGVLGLSNNLEISGAGSHDVAIRSTDNNQTHVFLLGQTSETASLTFDPSANTLGMFIGGNNALLIDGSRNIGIGITPTARFHVDSGSGSATAAIFEGDGINVKHPSGSNAFVGSEDGTNVSVGSINNTELILKTNDTERVRVTNEGNVQAVSSATTPILSLSDTTAGVDKASAGLLIDSSTTDADRKSSLVLNAVGGDLTNANSFDVSISGTQDVCYNNGGGTSQAIAFGGTEISRWDSNGELLINTTTRADGEIVIAKDESSIQFQTASDTGTGNGFRVGIDASVNGYLWNYENTALVFATNNAEKMRLDQNGELLLNTTTASSDTDVLLSIGDATRNETVAEIRGSGASELILTAAHDSTGSNGKVRYDQATKQMSFSTDTSAKFAIEDDGKTSLFSDDSTALIVGSTKTANFVDTLFSGVAAVTGLLGSGGTQTVRIATNGNIENANNSYGALSDQKLKTNIEPAESQWDDIKAVELKNFEFKPSVGIPGRQLGVIAQEIQVISPGLVEAHPDKVVVESPIFDSEGNPVLDKNGNQKTEFIEQLTGDETLSVKYSVLYIKALGALQEAMTRIEELEAKVAALES